MSNQAELSQAIATVERQISEAKSEVAKKSLNAKLERLKEELKSGAKKGTSTLATLSSARKSVRKLASKDFTALIEKLSKKPEYAFLKGYSEGKLKDDLARVAKPMGYRFYGENTKKPTIPQIKKGLKDGTVYYEKRPRHSDVSRVVQLGEGGSVSTETIDLKFYNIRGQVVESGKVIIDYDNETITLASGKTYKVEPDREYTYRFLKTKIRAVNGIKGLSEFLKDINAPKKALNTVVRAFIDSDESKMATGGSVGKFEYKTVNTSTESGLKAAEKLKADGWKVISTGLETIQFERAKEKKMEDGGRVDLFEDYENIPANIQEILDKYSDAFGGDGSDMDYKDTANMLKEFEAEGYTFDYGLDNEPFGLRPIGVKLNELRDYEDFDDDKMAKGGGVEDCIDYIKNSESIKNNGYYLHINSLNKYVDSGAKIPKIKPFCLITFNSGGQKNLKALDTINATLLSLEIAKLLNIDIELARIIVSEQTTRSKRFTMDMLDKMENNNIIVADRETIVCTNLSNKYAKGGGVSKRKTKGDIGKSGTQYGYTLKEYEEMAEKNGLLVSPSQFWKSQEGTKYKDSFGRTQTTGERDKQQVMMGYGYRIAILLDLGSKKIPASAKKYVEENNLSKFAEGGGVEKGYNNPEKATHVVNIDGFNWYLEKIDSTHFYMSNNPNSRGMAHHVDQHRGEPYYEEVRSWLKSTKYAEGGTIDNSFLGKTSIGKGFHGWTAETSTTKQIKGYDWEITTMKRYGGELVSTATGGKSMKQDGYSTFEYSPFEDPNYSLVRSKPKMVNEKAVTKQHEEALKIFIEKMNEISGEIMATGGGIEAPKYFKNGGQTYTWLNVTKMKSLIRFNNKKEAQEAKKILNNLNDEFTYHLVEEGDKFVIYRDFSKDEFLLNIINSIGTDAEWVNVSSMKKEGSFESETEARKKFESLSENGSKTYYLLTDGRKNTFYVYSDSNKSDKLVKEIMATGGTLEDNLLPPSKTYGENIAKAMEKFDISSNEARKKYGQYTIKQWSELLGEKMENGGEVGDISKSEIPRMQKITKLKGLYGYMPSINVVYYDSKTDKFYFQDFEGDYMEVRNISTLEQLDKFLKENNITLDKKMATGGGVKASEFETKGNTIYINGTKADVKKMYLDYVNNFLTIGSFADHYGISDKQASLIIENGREYAKKDGYYATGGSIPDNYEGRTSEDIWNSLSKRQRQHFLYDHLSEIEVYKNTGELPSSEIIKAYNSEWSTLDRDIKNRFTNHTREGQYATGGSVGGKKYSYLPNEDISKIVLKSKQVIGADRILDGAYIKSKGKTKSSEKFSFPVGSVVWDKTHKRYGVVLNNYGDEVFGSHDEIRLDSDGNQNIHTYDKKWNNNGYNLVPYGSEEDKGDGDLTDNKWGAVRIIEMNSNSKQLAENKKYYEDAYKDLLSGKIDGKPFKVNSEKVIGETSTGKSIYQKYTSMPDLSYEELKEASDIHKKFSKKAKTETEKETALKYSREFMRMANEEKFAKGLGKYAKGGGVDTDLHGKFGDDNPKLVNFDVDDLDEYETMVYNDFSEKTGKARALQILINNVEGDYTQLSPELAEIAEEQVTSDEWDEESNKRYFAEGGGVYGLKRFDVDFYDSSDAKRDTSIEISTRQNSLENTIEMAIKKAYDFQKNYIEFYYKNLFLGSINFATSEEFRKGKDYDKFMSDDKYAKGGGVSPYYGGMSEAEILKATVVYDNGGETLDRYTVFTPDSSVFGMSATGGGFNQYIGDDTEIEKGSHLGKRLKTVPKDIKSAVLNRMKEEFGDGGSMYKKGGNTNEDLSGNYFSSTDFVETHNLKGLAKETFGDNWESGGDYDFDEEEIRLLIKKLGGGYKVIFVDSEDRDAFEEAKANYFPKIKNKSNDGDLFVIPTTPKFKKGGNTGYAYVPNADIEKIVGKDGKEYGQKVLLDGAYVKDKVRTPKMSRTQFEEDVYAYGSGGNLGKSLYVANSSFFDYNSYDTNLITDTLKAIGAKNIRLERERPNSPEVVVFNGDKQKAKEALNSAFDTETILIYEKDWRTSKYGEGGAIEIQKMKKEKEKMVSELFEKCGVFFAFSDKQFEENKTPLKEGEKYVSIGGGGYLPKGKVKELEEGMEAIERFGKQTVEKKNLVEAEILDELQNHECFYTGDISDVVDLFEGTYTKQQIRDVYNKHREANQEYALGGEITAEEREQALKNSPKLNF